MAAARFWQVFWLLILPKCYSFITSVCTRAQKTRLMLQGALLLFTIAWATVLVQTVLGVKVSI